MRITSEKMYNYPMFAKDYSDYVDNVFSADINMSADNKMTTISVQTKITNSFILEQLKCGKFGLFLHVECLKTRFRNVYQIAFENLEEEKFNILTESLLDDIEAMLFIAALEEVTVVGTDAFDSFYQNETFIFPEYAYVGYTDTSIFVLSKEDKMSVETSIVKICVDKNINQVVYDLTSEIIAIFLPQTDYENYLKIAGKAIRIKHAILAEQAVIHALTMVKQYNSEYCDKKWYRILMNACNNVGVSESDVLDGNIEAYLIASKILKNPTSDALNELVKEEFEES